MVEARTDMADWIIDGRGLALIVLAPAHGSIVGIDSTGMIHASADLLGGFDCRSGLLELV